MRYNNVEELSKYIVEEINDIIDEFDHSEHPLYSSFAHRPNEHFYNDVSTTDDGFFLIVEDWDDVVGIGSELIRRYPFIREESYCDLPEGSESYSYAHVLDLFLEWQWGFSDEYGTCSHCGCPLKYDEHEYLIDDGEITCFDCLDDEYYVEEYLPYTTAVYEEIASQGSDAVRINLKLSGGELEDCGYEPYKQDLAVGMYEREYQDPRDVISNAPDGYTYIVTPRNIASFGSNPFQYDYEVWYRPIDY